MSILGNEAKNEYTPSEMIPTDLAIALAVMGWSPVTMMTLIPAERHLATASGTAARGGSIMDMRPTNRIPLSGKFGSSQSNLKPNGNLSEGSKKSQKPADEHKVERNYSTRRKKTENTSGTSRNKVKISKQTKSF